MKKKLKNPFIMVLITVVCIALFANFSWASSSVIYNHKTSYDTNSRNIVLAGNVKSGHSGYYQVRRYGNHGHNKYTPKPKYSRNRYSNKHGYYRKGYGHYNKTHRQRHGSRSYYRYKHGHPGHYRGDKNDYRNRHYGYRNDDKYDHQGYKSDFSKGYNKHPEHAYKNSSAQVTRINKSKGHIYVDGGKNAGFVMGAKVCIYSIKGEETTCGRVRKTSKSHAMVEVNNRKAKYIKIGMGAMLAAE